MLPGPPLRPHAMLIRTIPATIHGRYLLDVPAGGEPRPLLVGFHGYGQNAEIHLDQLRGIPGADDWILAAVQGLHAFYDRTSTRVLASWMTRLDRELAIADNIRYVGQVVAAIRRECSVREPLVYAGFSQGVAMAYRAAAAAGDRSHGLIVLGGDVPPELADQRLDGFPPVLLGRGLRDEWYTAEKAQADLAFLRTRGVAVEEVVFEGGHEWSPAFQEAAGAFLRRLPVAPAPAAGDVPAGRIHVRPAAPADAPALARLRYEFRRMVGAPVESETDFVTRCERWMAPRLAAGGPWRCWVAADGPAVAGHLWLQIVEKIPNPVGEREQVAYLTNFYVQPAARGGVGSALLTTALTWCRESGVERVLLGPTARSRPLYLRHGFQPPDDLLQLILSARVPG